MANRQYELTYILPPSFAEADINTLLETVQSWITDQQGEILKVNHWGRRKLAYTIQNYKEGYYLYVEFQSEPAAIKDVDRRLRLDTNVLRHLIVKKED